MSVLIKSMDMPASCWDCPLERYSECYNGREIESRERPEWCPLHEVTEDFKKMEHGKMEHGKWVEVEGEGYDTCSLCGGSDLIRGLACEFDYCPHCGAKMDL